MSDIRKYLARPGVLPRQFIKEAIQEGYLSAATPFVDSQFQPASIDVRLGPVAYRFPALFLPDIAGPIEEFVDSHAEYEVPLNTANPAILEDHPYVIPLLEQVALPETLRGVANPKSSIGRLDVFVRLFTDGGQRFDEIPAGYRGRLWALVLPRSFPIKAREGIALAQIRLLTSTPGASLTDEELAAVWAETPLLYRRPINGGQAKPIGATKAELDTGLFLSADLHRPRNAPVAYTPAAPGEHVIDLGNVGHYPIEKYWRGVTSDSSWDMVLKPDEFYLIRCRERLSIPPTLAAEMLPYDRRLGEIATHYAGFFDPGFGFDPTGASHGTQAVAEVRSQEHHKTIINHGRLICRLQFLRMLDEPDVMYGDPRLRSSYQRQRWPFSKHFAPQSPEARGPANSVQLDLEMEE